MELAETRSELTETKAKLAEERADRRKLTGAVADLSEENKRLMAELAEARGKPGESAEAGEQTRVDKSSGTVSRDGKAEHRDDAYKPWYKKLPAPGEKATELFTAGATAAETIGVATHSMNSTTETVVAAAIGLGVAGYGYARSKRKDNKENDG